MPHPFVPVALPSFQQMREGLIKATRGGGFPVQTPTPPPAEDPEGEVIAPGLNPQAESRQAYLAYRGTEMHGVPSPDGAVVPDAEGYGPGTIDVVYDERPKGGTVIDVRVISDSSEQMTAWRVNQLIAPAAGSAPTNVASRQRNRTKLQIKNMSPDQGLWIGPAAELTAFNGYLIDPGDEITLSSTEAVFALANGPNLGPVCLLTEFVQEA